MGRSPAKCKAAAASHPYITKLPNGGGPRGWGDPWIRGHAREVTYFCNCRILQNIHGPCRLCYVVFSFQDRAMYVCHVRKKAHTTRIISSQSHSQPLTQVAKRNRCHREEKSWIWDGAVTGPLFHQKSFHEPSHLVPNLSARACKGYSRARNVRRAQRAEGHSSLRMICLQIMGGKLHGTKAPRPHTNIEKH
jgi:hypothetical protein